MAEDGTTVASTSTPSVTHQPPQTSSFSTFGPPSQEDSTSSLVYEAGEEVEDGDTAVDHSPTSTVRDALSDFHAAASDNVGSEIAAHLFDFQDALESSLSESNVPVYFQRCSAYSDYRL